MSVYQTKPRRLILCFLQQHPNRSYTAEELANALAAEYGAEEAPGKSTVYRLVSRLAQEDLIRRFEREGSHQSYYQITGCCGAPAHLHLKCTGCGRLIHMENQASDQLLDEILKSSHFAVDEHQTVLYGRCRRCRAREGAKGGPADENRTKA